MKKYIYLIMAIPFIFCSCSNSKSDNSAEVPTQTPNTHSGKYYTLEYDSSEIPDELAKTIEKYFHSIETENYDDYISVLYDDYISSMTDYLKKQGQDEDLHTVLGEMSKALQYYSGENSTESSGKKTYTLTGITLSKGLDDDRSAHISHYRSTLGDDFANKIENDCDESYDIYFTLRGKTDSGDEGIMLENNELMAVKSNGNYFVLG